MVTCDQQEKVLSSQNVLLWIFLERRYLIYRYAELNRLSVGLGLITLNIKLQQDDRTVCCAHKIVQLEFPIFKPKFNMQKQIYCTDDNFTVVLSKIKFLTNITTKHALNQKIFFFAFDH